MIGMAIRKASNPFALPHLAIDGIVSNQDRFVIDSLLILSFIVNSRQPSPECGSEELTPFGRHGDIPP